MRNNLHWMTNHLLSRTVCRQEYLSCQTILTRKQIMTTFFLFPPRTSRKTRTNDVFHRFSRMYSSPSRFPPNRTPPTTSAASPSNCRKWGDNKICGKKPPARYGLLYCQNRSNIHFFSYRDVYFFWFCFYNHGVR